MAKLKEVKAVKAIEPKAKPVDPAKTPATGTAWFTGK